MEINKADVAELVDARDLKSLDGNVVWVRVPPPAPSKDALRATGPRRRVRNIAAGWPCPGHGNRTGTDVGYRCWASCNAPVPVLGHGSEKRVRCAFWL